MNLFAITNLLCGAFCLLLGLFAFLAGKNRIYQLLAGFNLTVSVWGFGTFAASISTTDSDAVAAWRIAHSSGFFIAAFFYHLVSSLIGVQHRKTQILGYVQAVIFIALTCGTPWVLSETRIYHGFIYVVATPLYAIAVGFYLFYVLLSFVELARYLTKAEGDKKKQAECFFYGFFVGFLGGTSLLLPEFYLDWVYPAGNAGVFIYAAIITYAVLKNRILDVQEIADAFQREKMAVLGTMAASLNHEIRNPLFVIKGKAETYIDALERKKYVTSEEVLEAGKSTIQPILNQAVRALDIIQKFTDFARPFSVKAPRERVVLREVFQDVQELISSELRDGQIQLSHNLTNGLAVYANRRHIEEILSNLVINACHAMGDSGGEVTVSAKNTGKIISIEVSDTGSGITRENLARVFDPFFTTKGAKGSGLGLYITRRLAEQNNGKISVTSSLGKGTTFLLEFSS